MEATCSEDYAVAFVVTESDIKKLCGLLESRVGKVMVEASCADGLERKFENVKSLTTFENPRSQRISSLSVTARSEDFSKSAEVKFSDGEFLGGTHLRLRGPEIVVSRLRSDILLLLEGTRPWWARMARLNFIFVLSGMAILGFIALQVLVALGLIGTSRDESTSSARSVSIGSLIVWGTFAAVFIVGGICNRFRRRLFPISTFMIGSECQREKTLENIRWVVIGLLASLVAGLAILPI